MKCFTCKYEHFEDNNGFIEGGNEPFGNVLIPGGPDLKIKTIQSKPTAIRSCPKCKTLRVE